MATLELDSTAAVLMAQHHALRVLIEMNPAAEQRLRLEGPLVHDMWLLEPVSEASIERLRFAWSQLLPPLPGGQASDSADQ